MTELAEIAPAFVEMAHQIVWCSAATVDSQGRPRSRVLHPIWEWTGRELVGWIATGPTPTKRAHLEASPHVSVNYWAPSQDTCVAECRASWHFDDETRTRTWNLLKNAPAPVGYDPAIIPVWNRPTDDSFAALRLEPWRLRVFPGTALIGQGGDILNWREG
ncbi:MAG: pyridoxamine 5'-phosphate oxidase family protein [bacterium]|nr:pyridoxamine 5'-phosphate oxidase family protein [bacterium]